ncbi:MAG: glycosyl hydrolase [Xanthomonadales bacterium]|nr:glycosyl hydrolase [Xanthomonadales bacterium]
MRLLVLFASCCLLLLSAPETGFAKAPDQRQDSPYGALEYRLIGPSIGGRFTRVTGVPGSPVLYAAAAQGGVWKSVNDGLDWEPVFDGEISQSIGAIALAPSDPNVVYVGGGEANPRGNVAIGLGIWKSLDAGKTWKHLLKLRGQIGNLVVHPRDPDVAWAAVLGSPFGPGPERGVYRTRDGGRSWQLVLKKDADTGAADVALDPNNPNILYASLWRFRRTPWSATSGGPGSALYRSADGGETWTQLQGSGLPDGEWGKVGVRVAPSDSRRVYAIIEAAEGGLYRSDDAGESWKRVNAHRALRQRAWYYCALTIDPRNADIVWIPQVPLLRSIDGGRSVQSVSGPHHGDHHDLWIDPADPRRILSGNDGGLDLSRDGGESWYTPPLPLAQFYNLDVDDSLPYQVAGTIQDWGTAVGPVRSWVNEDNPIANWLWAGGGEAGDVLFDRSTPGAIYAGEYGGYLSHSVLGTGQHRMVSAWPANPSGQTPAGLRYRFQWTAPRAGSEHDPNVVYHGANVLFRSVDQGHSWSAISPDLTRNDRSKQQWSGGPITGDLTGVETYGTIFSIAESPLRAGVLWVGSDDGLVHLSRDGGAHWTNVTPRGMPEWGTVESIEASRRDPGSAYVVVHRYRLDDFRPYLFRTRDYGASWQSLGQGLPADLLLWVLREDREDPDWLYLGTDRGIWHSRDAGAHWEDLTLNLPRTTVTDLEVRHGDLVVATRGRSLWVLEGLAALRALPQARSQALALLPAIPGYRFREQSRWDFLVRGGQPNPPYGAVIHYWLGAQAKGELSLEILDAQGRTLRTLSSLARPPKYPEDDPDEPEEAPEPALAKEAGLRRAVWDLRLEGARRLAAKYDAGAPEAGPLALPGRYTLRLRVDGQSVDGEVEVRADPRAPDSDALAANLAFALSLREALDRCAGLVEALRAVKEQAADRRERHAGEGAIVAAADALLAAVKQLEGRAHNPEAEVVYDVLAGRDGGSMLYSQLAPLYSWAQESDHAPTQGMLDRRAQLLAELGELETRFAAIREGELRQLEQALDAAHAPRIVVPGT